MTIIEEIKHPTHIGAELSYFRCHAFADLVEAAQADQQFSAEIDRLHRELESLIRRCERTVAVADTSKIIDDWDSWCELFEGLEHAEFEEQILDVFKALPCD